MLRSPNGSEHIFSNRLVRWFGAFPRLVRRRIRPILLAAVLFLVPALLCCLAVHKDPALTEWLPGQSVMIRELMRLETPQGEYRGNFSFSLQESPRRAVGFINKNLIGAFLSFFAGVLLCLPGMLLLIYEGCFFGIVSGLIWRHGTATLGQYYSLILTHFVVEFTAICLAGGAGLLVGWILIRRGQASRLEAFRRVIGDALGLFAGAMVLLIFGGLIEAFITPHATALVRWSVAGGSGLLVIGYFGWAGRKGEAVNF